jgi:hypothetical protein
LLHVITNDVIWANIEGCALVLPLDTDTRMRMCEAALFFWLAFVVIKLSYHPVIQLIWLSRVVAVRAQVVPMLCRTLFVEFCCIAIFHIQHLNNATRYCICHIVSVTSLLVV